MDCIITQHISLHCKYFAFDKKSVTQELVASSQNRVVFYRIWGKYRRHAVGIAVRCVRECTTRKAA